MKFEVGKTYQHSTGKRITIIGRLKTHLWGECLIGETNRGELVPVGEQEDHSVNWVEVEYPYKESGDEKMSNLEKAKEIVKRNYMYARCGIFDSRNLLGDEMCTIYKDESLTIDICYAYSYFEVFGLSDAEFEELEEYYYSLEESEDKK